MAVLYVEDAPHPGNRPELSREGLSKTHAW